MLQQIRTCLSTPPGRWMSARSGSFTRRKRLSWWSLASPLTDDGLMSAAMVLNNSAVLSSAWLGRIPSAARAGYGLRPLDGVGMVDLGPTGAVGGSGTMAAAESLRFRLQQHRCPIQVVGFPPGAIPSAMRSPACSTGEQDRIRQRHDGNRCLGGQRQHDRRRFHLGWQPGAYDLTNVSFAAGRRHQLLHRHRFSTMAELVPVAPPFFNWTGAVSTDYGTADN